jgi:hypothetical protein
MKTYGKVEILSTFLDLGPRRRLMVSFVPLLLYPHGKSPRYPLDTWLGGPQKQSGYCEEEKKLALLGTEPELSSL